MNKLIGSFFLFSIMATSCAGEENTILASVNYGLSDQEISTLSEQANAGSASAATRLSDRYFADRTPGKAQEMQAKALEWALVGAENGSAQAQFRVYQILRTSDEKSKKIRALFWLKLSAKNGDEDAQNNLEDCPDIDAKSDGIPCFGKGSDGNN